MKTAGFLLFSGRSKRIVELAAGWRTGIFFKTTAVKNGRADLQPVALCPLNQSDPHDSQAKQE